MRWKISNKLEEYSSSIEFMETEVLNIAKKGHDDLTWILEYPPLYTSGLEANKDDLLIEKDVLVRQYICLGYRLVCWF